MARHTVTRNPRKSRRRPVRQARRRRSVRLTVPVIWGPAAKPGKPTRQKGHAASWRTRFARLSVALLASPRWVSLLLLVAIGLCFYAVGREPSFFISDVRVSGNDTLADDALVRASRLKGMHLFWADAGEAAKRVAEIPSVLTATVAIDWNGQADLSVTERTPVMVWEQAGDRFWVDSEGRLMQARQQTPHLLTVFSQEEATLYGGDRIPPEALAGARQLKALRPNIASLHYEQGPGLSYHDGRDWRAYFGVGVDMNQKLAVYERLVDELQARDVQPKYISVVNKDKPFYRLAAPAY